jgi:hypothetical protein
MEISTAKPGIQAIPASSPGMSAGNFAPKKQAALHDLP